MARLETTDREVQGVLHGTRVTLRPVREDDLDAMYLAHIEIGHRGAFFPLGVVSESAFKKNSTLGFVTQEWPMSMVAGQRLGTGSPSA